MRCQRCNGPWPGNALGFDHRWSIRLVNTPFNPLLREGRLGIDPQGTQQLFAPLWAQQDRSGVRFTTDLAYGPDARHRLDVYQPDTGHPVGDPPPVVVFVHGGGFVRGDKSERTPVGVAFAQAGCVVVVPNYRLGPTHRWPAGAEDVASVVAWVVSHAHLHGGDTQRVFVVGESAGAAHVATALLVRRFHPAGGLPVAGAVLVSGSYNPALEGLSRTAFGIPTPDPRNEAYFGPDPNAWPGMSLVRLIDAPPGRLLITYAEWDPPQFQVAASELYARLVCDHGHRPELAVVPGHNHLSQVFAIGTGDRVLLDRVLGFVFNGASGATTHHTKTPPLG